MSTFKRYNGTNWETIGGGIAYSKYSTTEQVVGQWIDNKPIYRKVIQFTTGASGTWVNVATGLQNGEIDTLVEAKCLVIRGNNTYYMPLPFYEDSGLYGNISYSYNGTIIYVRVVGNDMASKSGNIIIEYTKTTDQVS